MMAFMMKKKRYKFIVQLCVEDLTAVPFLNAVLFIKVRLLDGGNFSETSSREEVRDHMVRWEAKFKFECKMSANASTGVLEPCALRISVRKELKGGKSFQKLGFTDLNLAEFAGCGETTRRCLLEGYDSKHRQDNSMLRININMNMLSGDVLFKVPSPSSKHKQLMSSSQIENDSSIITLDTHNREDFPGGSITSSSGSGLGSLSKKRPILFDRLNSDNGIIGAQITDTISEVNSNDNHNTDELLRKEENDSACHSRNSSSASHLSKLSHSRQSSSGESGGGHTRNTASSLSVYHRKFDGGSGKLLMVNNSEDNGFLSDMELHSQNGVINNHQIPTSTMTALVTLSRRTSQITLSGSSCLSETGSLDRGKSALERRKKAAEENVTSGRVEITRVNTDTLIEQLIKSTNLESTDETTSSSGLQLFISKDGTTTLGGQDAKHQISSGVFQKVVMEEHR